MPEALRRLLHARLAGFLREPEAVFWTFGFPILIAIALGIAFRNKGPEKIDVAVAADAEVAAHFADLAREYAHPVHCTPGEGGTQACEGTTSTAISPAVKVGSALVADSALNVSVTTEEDAGRLLRAGNVALVVFPDAMTFRYDPTRPESRAARMAVEAALNRSAGIEPAFRATDEQVTEPGARYIDFLIPGLIGMNIMSTAMWGIGHTIVESRGRKLLKRFAATPMPRAYYLASYLLAHLLLDSALLAVTLAFARLAFDVRVFGSYLSVYVIALLGAATFAGLGLLVATRTESSETLSGLNNAVMLPMFVASGVFFSSAHFPAVVQPLIKALPLTALNEAMRMVMTDGKPLAAAGLQLAILAVWGVLCFALALRWFRWT